MRTSENVYYDSEITEYREGDKIVKKVIYTELSIVQTTDNGFEYDATKVIITDEPDAIMTATEYLKDGEIVRRDVNGKLKPKVLGAQLES